MTAIPVAILGGGPYAARLCEVLAAWPGMPALELRLHARDPERLAVIAAHSNHRVGVAHEVRACPELDGALADARVVVLLVRVGGMAARDHDERFPAQFALVGDEGVGVGGMANAWRTLPILDHISTRIAARARGAHVLNMMAPLGITTRLLHEHGHRTVGLCELPAVTLARWSMLAAEPAPPLCYAGLNHLGFFWSPELGVEHPVLRAAITSGEVPASVVGHYGAAPLHYFVDVFAAPGRRRLGRARELAEHHALLVEQFAVRAGERIEELDRRTTPWFEHALAPALHAVLGGPPFRAPLDLPNHGRLAEAGDDVVVELAGQLSAETATLDPVFERPPEVRAVLGRFARAEDTLYRAARMRDRALLRESLEALPLAIRAGDREPILDSICEQVA